MEKIQGRIEELEEIKENMNNIARGKRIELAEIEAQANEIKKVINANSFENTSEYRELQELKTTKKWLDIYNNKE